MALGQLKLEKLVSRQMIPVQLSLTKINVLTNKFFTQCLELSEKFV